MTLQVQLCGKPQVLRGGQVLSMPRSNKTLAILAYLGMNDRVHRRQQLADMLWDVADDPRGGLRWCLSKLRPLLDEDARPRIVADRETVSFDGADVDIDARAVLACDLEAADAPELSSLCERIQGDFCEGLNLEDLFGFHAWCVGHRQDLRRRHARMRERLVRLLGDDPEAALPHARVLCSLQPDSEVAHAQQVDLLVKLGHMDEAQTTARSARKRLRQRTGQSDFPELELALGGHAHKPAAAPPPVQRQSEQEPPRQKIRFCTSADGTSIAYAEVGQGPPLVKVANWISHLEHEFRSPVWSHVLRELSRDHRLIRYDQRGNGLSQRRVDDVGAHRQVQDLEAVMVMVMVTEMGSPSTRAMETTTPPSTTAWTSSRCGRTSTVTGTATGPRPR